jgi:hypothetical protein
LEVLRPQRFKSSGCTEIMKELSSLLRATESLYRGRTIVNVHQSGHDLGNF